MEVGTVETLDTPDEKRRTAPFRFGGGPQNGGGGGGSDGGGGGGSDDGGGGGGRSAGSDGDVEKDPKVFKQKSRILTTFLLIVVLMTFGGLIAAYVVLKLNGSSEWRPFDLPLILWFSTSTLIASSITYYLAERAFGSLEQLRAKKFLLATTVLGAVFIAAQTLTWVELNRRGLYVQGNPYTGFFYILTAVHAAHVIGGIVALSTVLLRSWYPTRRENDLARRVALANVVGWYWHFMGFLWLVIVGLLGFLK